jgi:hypothetical protein
MKLLLENWRQYLAESEKAQDYGYLYLFEDDTVRQTSFYDALNLLSENENAIETFLENWERSVDYHIEQIDEGAIADLASNPILSLSTQAFMLLNRLKEKAVKYAGKILGVINKVRSFLSRFEEKHPTLYKMGTFAIKIVVAILVIYAMSHIFGGGEAQAGNILSPPEFDEAGEIVQRITASEEDLRKIGEAASNVEGLKEVGQELLEIANHPVDVTGGVGGEVSWKAQKVIEHALQVMEGADTAGGSDLATQNTRIFGPMIDAAKAAAEGATEAVRVTQATISDPDAAEAAQQAADVARKAGLR